jgi:uncharacterized protein YrzB (UPF0473 family)
VSEFIDDECEVIVLTDEEGTDHEFELIELLEVGDREYAVLAPLDDEEAKDDDEGEAIILRVETNENGERIFSDIDDDEEWEEVASAWESSLEEDYEDDEDLDEDEDED